VVADVGGVKLGGQSPGCRPVHDQYRHCRCPLHGQPGAALARAGSELVRVTVNTERAAAAVPGIVEALGGLGVRVPIVGDFHYNGHLLLKKYPACARALAKYRINPGNVDIGRKTDDNFRTMIEAAVEHGKPVRIGVNWGSLDAALLTRMMEAKLASGCAQGRARGDAGGDGRERPAVGGGRERYGLAHNQIVLSAKVSGVRDLLGGLPRDGRGLRLPPAPRAHGSRLAPRESWPPPRRSRRCFWKASATPFGHR